jgi:anti-sigma B factor antagonist
MVCQTVAHDEVPFSLVSDAHEGRLDLSLRGELDLACSDMLSRFPSQDHAGLHEVVVDATSLDFIDTAGVRALVEVRSRSEAGGRTFAVTNPTALVRRVVTLFGREDLLAPV